MRIGTGSEHRMGHTSFYCIALSTIRGGTPAAASSGYWLFATGALKRFAVANALFFFPARLVSQRAIYQGIMDGCLKSITSLTNQCT